MKPKMIEHKDLWNNGYVELWDFSNANANMENRQDAISLIGGVCRNTTIKNPKKFYNRLMFEHNTKPSEIFQFIPVIDYIEDTIDLNKFNKYYRFGHADKLTNTFYTNLRNLINYTDNVWTISNNVNEQPELKKYVVFKVKIPYMIIDHLRRHKLLNSSFNENWQSNRIHNYKDEYFENDIVNIKHITVEYDNDKQNDDIYIPEYKTDNTRSELINKGEFGLRYQTGWIGGWINDEYCWDNFFGVRLQKPTQKETIELSSVMYDMLHKHFDYSIKI